MKTFQMFLYCIVLARFIAACGDGIGHEGDKHNHHAQQQRILPRWRYLAWVWSTPPHTFASCITKVVVASSQVGVPGMGYVKHAEYVKDRHQH